MSRRDLAWRGLAAFVFAVCGGALWLGGAGSLQAAQRIATIRCPTGFLVDANGDHDERGACQI